MVKSSDRSNVWQFLAGAGGAVSLYLVLFVFTWTYAQEGCRVTPPQIYIDGTLVGLPDSTPVEVTPGDSLEIAAEFEATAATCATDWELSTNAGPVIFQIQSESPVRKSIAVTLSDEATEGQVTLTIRDLTANEQKTVSIPLVIEGN